MVYALAMTTACTASTVARLVENAIEVKCSEFRDALIFLIFPKMYLTVKHKILL